MKTNFDFLELCVVPHSVLVGGSVCSHRNQLDVVGKALPRRQEMSVLVGAPRLLRVLLGLATSLRGPLAPCL